MTSSRPPTRGASHDPTSLFALVVATLGALVLAGWFLDIPMLKSVSPEWVTMKANAAFCFVLAGAALHAAQAHPLSIARRRVSEAGAGIVLLIALLTLGAHLFDWGGALDQLLIRDFGTSGAGRVLGRMAITTAGCFALSACTILLIARDRPDGRIPAVVPLTGAVLSAVGVLTLMGYFGDLILNITWWNKSLMAFHTAAGFVLLGLGTIGIARRRNRMNWAVSRAATVSFIAAVTLLLGAGAITIATLKTFARTAASVAHAHRVHTGILDVKAALGEAIAAQRAFILTSQDRYLATARAAMDKAVDHEGKLRELMKDNVSQQARLERGAGMLRTLADGMTIGSARLEQSVAATEGETTYEELLSLLDSMDAEEREHLQRQQQRSQRDFELALRFIPTGTLLSVVLLCGVLFTLNREVGERRRAADSLAADRTLLRTLIDLLPEYIYVKDDRHRFVLCNAACSRRFGVATSTDLLGRTDVDFFSPERAEEFRREDAGVMEGTAVIDREETFARPDGIVEIILTSKVPLRDAGGRIIGLVGTGRDITGNKRAEEAIQRLNAGLEQRVTERTAQLETANHELEAFSYSVSHDLRGPLRAMAGYSDAIIEDFGSVLPEEGRRYLRTIRSETQRMGQLIDDLLEFARLNRQSMQQRHVENDTLVREALAELHGQQQGREIEIRMGELAPCRGDRALLKQVWTNLLANALKYSRNRTHAVIEIGCTRTDGVNTYFVRDNGAGFDMRYAEKLFGVFQRLHRADEFEGTGVGLAIAQRIVQRHGGRIWAEAEADRGATFFFSLPADIPENPTTLS